MSSASASSKRALLLAGDDILDTPAGHDFDDVVALACTLCSTPVAQINLVTPDRQWPKASVGLVRDETPIGQSICAHVIGSKDVLVIPDMREDPRTCDNPLVRCDPHFCFYAGAPLLTPEGISLGMLCVMDHDARPEGLSPAQTKALEALARQTLSLMALRRATAIRDKALADQKAVILPQETLIATQRRVSNARGVLDTILDIVVRGVLDAMPSVEGCVFEEIEGDHLVHRHAVGTCATHVGMRILIRASLSGACVLAEKAILCADVLADARSDMAAAASLGL